MIQSLGRKIKKAKRLGVAKSFRLAADKARRKLKLLPGVPPTLYIELTDICNLDCLMCDRAGMARKSGMMEMSLFEKVIDNAVRIGVPSVKLNRFGETLLHPGITGMIKYAKEKGVPWVYFTSNATLLTEKKARELLSTGLDSITFSFDGATRETYEKIRVNAKFDSVRENILRFIEMRNSLGRKSPRVVINTIYSNETENEIKDVFRMWAPHVEKINVLPVGKYGNVEDLSPVQRVNGIKRRACHQIFDRLMVFWDGMASVCCADINGALSVGRFGKSSIEELWKGRAFSELRSAHKRLDFSKYPICEKCDGTDAVQFKKLYEERERIYKDSGYRNSLKERR